MDISIQESEISSFSFYPSFSGSTYYSYNYPVIYTIWYWDPCRRVIPAFENYTRIYLNYGILCTQKFTNWEFYLYMDQQGYNWLQNWKKTQAELRGYFAFYKKDAA